MADYITVAELKTALNPSNVDPANTAASLPDPVLETVITNAETEINARLGTRYDTPFPAPVPSLVTRLVTDFAVYHATLAWRATVDLEERDPVQLRYQAAKKLLEDIVAGRASVPGVDESTGTAAGVGEPINKHQYPIFEDEDFDVHLVHTLYHGPEYVVEGWHH